MAGQTGTELSVGSAPLPEPVPVPLPPLSLVVVGVVGDVVAELELLVLLPPEPPRTGL